MWKFDKSDKKWGRYDILNFHDFQRNISWTVDKSMQMNELMISSPHNFPFVYIILYEIVKNFFFFVVAQTCKSVSPCSILHLFRVAFYFPKLKYGIYHFHHFFWTNCTWKTMMTLLLIFFWDYNWNNFSSCYVKQTWGNYRNSSLDI